MKQTLLVVEDEAFLAFELCSVLEDAGYRVITAWSLDAAVPVIDSGVLSLAVIDLGLPTPSDGGNVARRLADRGVPIVVCSGLSPETAREALGDVEPIEVLSKPMHPAKVLAAVRAALG